MVREDIVTALRNAVNSGESLEYAMQVMINSGYDTSEVQEASQFVGGGIIQTIEPKPGEELAMPNQKRIFGGHGNLPNKDQTSPIPQPGQSTLSSPTPEDKMPSPFSNGTNTSDAQIQPKTPQEKKIQKQADKQIDQDIETTIEKTPKKRSFFVEILLFIILLTLVGTLIGTVIYREELISFLSGLVN